MTALDVRTDESLSRSYRFTQLPNSDGLTLEGYVAVFDEPTSIQSWEGDFTETIKRGAFARVVRQRPGPVIQFDHGQHPLLGSIPIASLTSMKEDKKGLFISARIHDNWLTEPIRDAIRSGSIDGMSFRFKVVANGESWNPDRSERTITDVDVPEFGPVVFPAYQGTEVSVRSQQLADALQSDEVRHDLAIALLMETANLEPDLTGEESGRSDEEPSDPETRDQAGPEEASPTDDVGGPEEASAPNPAKTQATVFAARAVLASHRSNYEPNGLPDQ